MKRHLRSLDDVDALRLELDKASIALSDERREHGKLKDSFSRLKDDLVRANEQLLAAKAALSRLQAQRAATASGRDLCAEFDEVVIKEIQDDFEKSDDGDDYSLRGNGAAFCKEWSQNRWVAARSASLSRFITRVVDVCRRGREDADATTARERIEICIAMAIASVYRAIRRDIAFDLGKRITLACKLTGESSLCDLIAKIVPGGRTSSALDKMITRAKENEQANGGLALDLKNSMLIVTYDNISKSYSGAVTARLTESRHNSAIVSNKMALIVRDPARENLQRSQVHAPSNWRSLHSTPHDILNVRKTNFKDDDAVECVELCSAKTCVLKEAIEFARSEKAVEVYEMIRARMVTGMMEAYEQFKKDIKRSRAEVGSNG